MLGDALNYIGGSLEKPGRAVRGLLTGNLREGLAAVPFSDSMGLTDPSQKVTGRKLTDMAGITRTGDKGWGSWLAGGAADMATDPLSYIPMHSVFKGLKMGSAAEHGLTATPFREAVQGSLAPLPVDTTAMKLGSKVNDASRPRRFSLDPARKDYYAQSRSARFADRLGFGNQLDPETRSMISPALGNHSFGLKYDNAYGPPPAPMRSSPEWINNRTFYHGGGTPGIHGLMLDPMKTAPDNLYGRGIYTTADQKIAGEYTEKGVAEAGTRISQGLTQSPFYESALERAKNGDFDEFLKTHGNVLGYSADKVATLRPTMKQNLMKRLAEEHFNPIPKSILGEDYENAPRRLAAQAAAEFYSPHLSSPKPSLYAAQSDFGKILDLEHKLPAKEYASLFDSLMPSFEPRSMNGHLPTGEPQSPGALIKSIAASDEDVDAMTIKALRGHGYDALTHTGGMALGGGIPHQVVIGLDPNDVLGLGRKTPYQRWEQVNAARKPSSSVLDGGDHGAAGSVHSGTGSQPGGAGLSVRLRDLRSNIPVFKQGGRVVGAGDWAGDIEKARGLHQELEGSGELLGANVPPWHKGNELIGDAAGTAGLYGTNPSVAREELMHAMTSKAAQEGNVGSLPMMARPAAHLYRAANKTGSGTLRGLGSIADELSAKTMAERTPRGKLGAALDFLLSPEAHLLYDQQFASHGFIPRAAYHSVPLASPAGALGAAGYSLASGE